MSRVLDIAVDARQGDILVRGARCGCAADFAVVFVGLERAKPLWLCVQTVEGDDLEDTFSGVLAQMEDPDWQDTARSGVAIFGCVWEALTHPEAVRQAIQFGSSPEWLLDVPLEEVWACRGVIWGRDDITRTAVALASVRGYWLGSGSGGDYYPKIVQRLKKLGGL